MGSIDGLLQMGDWSPGAPVQAPQAQEPGFWDYFNAVWSGADGQGGVGQMLADVGDFFASPRMTQPQVMGHSVPNATPYQAPGVQGIDGLIQAAARSGYGGGRF